MYILKQAVILAYDQLKEYLAPHRYYLIVNTVGMWKHQSRPIRFYLYVDNFGIKYVKKEDSNHYIKILKKNTKSQ